MITFYGDEVAPLNDKNYKNICQNIVDSNFSVQDFTGTLPIALHLFSNFKEPINFLTFDSYSPGKNVVIIGMHGGWNNTKLPAVYDWFQNDPNRLKAWQDPNCQIVFDYSEEGWADNNIFQGMWEWINEHNLKNRVLYITSCFNVNELYGQWCSGYQTNPNMRCAWYGFFMTWILDVNSTNQKKASHIPNSSRRFMTLNRRPHPHRILLLTLMQRHGLLGRGAVSMPKHFSEKEVNWQPMDWDIPYKWNALTDMSHGYIDYLREDFERLYTRLPLVADTDNFSINYAMDLNDEYYAQFPINIVTETFFLQDAIFASEKIWKPMLLGQIFIVMSSPFFLATLRKLGFRTFSPYINEEYDQIINHWERATAIIKTLSRIVDLDEDKFQQLVKNCQPIIDHNIEMISSRENIIKIVTACSVALIENFWEA